MRSFLIVLQFLTVIPVKLKEAVKENELARSIAYFPLVGLLLGVILVLVNFVSVSLFPPLVAKTIVLIALVILTGALPLDGFANTCEGFFSRKPREEILAYMRESRLGSRGIIGLVFLLLIKVALLYGLSKRAEYGALLLMPVIGRWAMVVMGTITPYAGDEKEDPYALARDDYRYLLRASVITFVIALLLFRLFVVPLMAIVYLSVWALRRFSLEKVGGITTGVLGATVELAEVVALMLIVFMVQ